MKIGETVHVVVDSKGKIMSSEIYTSLIDACEEVKAWDMNAYSKPPHRVVPVTLQPAGDAELLERAVKVLEDIRNRLQLCYGDERDTATEQRIDEFLAAARREVK